LRFASFRLISARQNAESHLNTARQFTEKNAEPIAALLQQPHNPAFFIQHGTVAHGDHSIAAMQACDDPFISEDSGRVQRQF
jgi:hypothetical protein